MYAKWVQSWRDLPILINQWANVVRWEKVTRPFLRTTEFLWQEGHTAHETAEEAEAETLKILDLYADAVRIGARDAGREGPQEREREVRRRAAHLLDRSADGRRPRAAGRHVAQPRAELREGVRHHVPGARQVGAARLGHVVGRDDAAGRRRHHDARRRQRPRAAAAPSRRTRSSSCRSGARTGARRCCRARRRSSSAAASTAGIRVTLDERDERPGWKFSEWELRGVPLRLEIGPKDIEKSQVLLARRDTREKLGVADGRPRGDASRDLLDDMQRTLLARAVQFREEHTQRVGQLRRLQDGDGRASRLRDRAVVRRSPTARRRSRPTRRRRSATCRSTAARRGRRACAATSRPSPKPGSRRRTDRDRDRDKGKVTRKRERRGEAGHYESFLVPFPLFPFPFLFVPAPEPFNRTADDRLNDGFLVAPGEVGHLDQECRHAVRAAHSARR